MRGGIVAYDTVLKHTLLGVPAELLAVHGPVHPDVAMHMAAGARSVTAIDGVPTDIGLSTTGVAGPDPQDGVEVGTVHIGIAIGTRVLSHAFVFAGDREAIRTATVVEALAILERELSESPAEGDRE